MSRKPLSYNGRQTPAFNILKLQIVQNYNAYIMARICQHDNINLKIIVYCKYYNSVHIKTIDINVLIC